jgi:hypothetical protein
MKSYAIHDNGGRPFRVDIQGNKVTVHMTKVTYEKVDGTFKDIVHPPKQILEFPTDAVFVGKKSPGGGYDGLKPKEAEGNSILLEVGAKYVYIGSEIYQFSPVKGDSIEKYYSNIGNSDVPYPYAIGKTHIYIMLDKVAVEKSFFDMKKGIYEQYYEATTYLKDRMGAMSKEEKSASRARMEELAEKTTKLKPKVLQKRI